jgi:hypothetical protein
MITLNTCVRGQKLRLRNGDISFYSQPVRFPTSKYTHEAIGRESGTNTYTDFGKYYTNRRRSPFDIVEILPLETAEFIDLSKDVSIAWWESCPWITDRLPTMNDVSQSGCNKNYVLLWSSDDIRPAHYLKVSKSNRWIHIQDPKTYNQTLKEKALALIARHKDGWVPMPEEWDIIREGLKE